MIFSFKVDLRRSLRNALRKNARHGEVLQVFTKSNTNI